MKLTEKQQKALEIRQKRSGEENKPRNPWLATISRLLMVLAIYLAYVHNNQYALNIMLAYTWVLIAVVFPMLIVLKTIYCLTTLTSDITLTVSDILVSEVPMKLAEINGMCLVATIVYVAAIAAIGWTATAVCFTACTIINVALSAILQNAIKTMLDLDSMNDS